jgi:hypothetical protein
MSEAEREYAEYAKQFPEPEHADFLRLKRAELGLLPPDETRAVYREWVASIMAHPFLGFHPLDLGSVEFVMCKVCQGTTRDGLCGYCHGQGCVRHMTPRKS